MQTSKYTVKSPPTNAVVEIVVRSISTDGVVTAHRFKAAECVHPENAKKYFENFSKAVRALVRACGGHSGADHE